MSSEPWVPRFHLFEINDQDWFPQYLREKVQSCLTLVWTLRIPALQSASPASLVTSTLFKVIPSRKFPSYTFVDFCAGAGGPTPVIERLVNERLASSAASASSSPISSTPHLNGATPPTSSSTTIPQVQFVLTDLFPHLPSWTALSKRSSNLTYVPTSIDASSAPTDLLTLTPTSGQTSSTDQKKIFRLFNLAFHHFDDPLARRILANTVSTSSAFAIFELQDRSFDSFVTILALGVLLMGISAWAFASDVGHLFWTYFVPVVPTVVVLDGFVSCLRTRTRSEVERLMPNGWREQGWRLRSGRETHTWPVGRMTWVIGVKIEEGENMGSIWT